MSFHYQPVPGKPGAFRVWRDCDGGEQWHPDQMLDRHFETEGNQLMIDPRKAPVAMLPYLNAVAAHFIAAAAPLRVANVEDTEQMITEAMEHCGIDPEAVDADLQFARTGQLDFEAHTAWLAAEYDTAVQLDGETELFLNTLKAVIGEAV